MPFLPPNQQHQSTEGNSTITRTHARTHTSAPHHSVLLQAGCPSCHPTNSVNALKGKLHSREYIGQVDMFYKKKVKAAHNNEEVATVTVTTGHMAAA